ncbi:MAG: hypothetical protein ABI345_01400, partial [Jatrophihabitans sp.]
GRERSPPQKSVADFAQPVGRSSKIEVDWCGRLAMFEHGVPRAGSARQSVAMIRWHVFLAL